MPSLLSALRNGPAWFEPAALVLFAVLGGAVLGKASLFFFRGIVRRTSTDLDDQLLARVDAPVSVGWALGVCLAVGPRLGLEEGALRSLENGIQVGLLVVGAWAALLVSDLVFARMETTARVAGRVEIASILPLACRAWKVVLVLVAGVMVLGAFGYPVTSLVAGLGIGGLALALAAQKTAENVFGSVSIGVDQPFKVGDFIGVDGLVGTVETLGLRSTRIRTLDRTVITIPNGRLADMKVENYTERDRMRLSCVLGLEYGTTVDQVRAVRDGVARVLRDHACIWRDTIQVRFRALGASSLDVEVMAWFTVKDWDHFVAVREEVLLSIMEVVEREGASFAFPTQTLHLRKET